MAAGGGERFGTKEPKQFFHLNDRPMMVWAVEPFSANAVIDGITVVVTPGMEDLARKVIADYGLRKVDRVVAGGETRQESVRLGLDALGPDSEKVLVHDAARPCLSDELLQRVLDRLDSADAVVPTSPVVDTLVHERGGGVDAILDRVNISGVQTPQGFRAELLVRAHRNALDKGLTSSDDGSLVYALGEAVQTVPGETTNMKLTFERDVPIIEGILERRRK